MENEVKNEVLVKELPHTPYNLIKQENGNVVIVIGRQLVSRGYTSFEEAEAAVMNAGTDNELLIATIAAVANIVYQNHKELINKAEENASK